MKYMSTNSVSNFTATVTAILPKNTGSYDITKFVVERKYINPTTLDTVTTSYSNIPNITVTNPTVSVDGSVTIPNISFSNTGGNSITIRYYPTPSTIVELGTTGAYTKGYEVNV